MRKQMKYGIAGILSTAVIGISTITALAADVDVYAEGAYTATDLVVNIYADIKTEDPLVSAGVRLTYDNSKLTLTSVEKNETDWYFGTTTQKYSYQEPQDTGSAVIFLCGKLDEGKPTAGVKGSRILIGTATFTRNETSLPVAAPESYFGAALGLGITRPAPAKFANFVTTGKAVLDDTASLDMTRVIIRERGDADADHHITNSDYFAIKPLINKTYVVYADCDADGYITNSDYFCVKGKINH